MDDNIDGEAIGTKFGSSVSLSSNGEIVAISASLYAGNGRNNSGHVRVYELNSNSGKWSQLGDDIDGEAEGDQSGSSVSLSDNGRIVAIAAPYNDGNGDDSGHVRVYELNESLQWIILGDDIDGEVIGDQFGFSVSLSGNGRTVAISSTPGNDDDYVYDDNTSSGYVNFYKW